jgi:hypothetical protein
MENNENFVTPTENVEQTTEETQQAKTYTQEEVDAIVGKRLARQEGKIRKEYDRQYSGLVDVLRAGTGQESVEEMTDTFRSFYEKKGVQIPNRSNELTEHEIRVLADADANEIIDAGYEEVVEELNRLADKGFDSMTAREKAAFKKLEEHRQSTELARELSSIGVTEDVYKSEDFQKFRSMFNSKTPIKDVYDIYSKQHKKDYRTAGSMKATPTDNSGVKDFYSFEEASRFTKEDFDKNPALYQSVVNSMPKWRK